MSITVFLCCLFYITAAETYDTNEKVITKIIGGSVVYPNTIPYQVALYIYKTNKPTSFCGGSLIDSNTVLTAAHCLTNAKSVLVVLGAHYVKARERTQLRMYSSDFTVHEQFSTKPYRNDVALVHLPRRIRFSRYINAISLPIDPNNDYVSRIATVSGWGRTSNNSTQSSVLRQTSMLVISNAVCGLSYTGLSDIHLCTSGSEGRSTCLGDSGSPLVIDNVQVGIVSYGKNAGCESKYPSVFARVSKFVEWINLHK